MPVEPVKGFKRLLAVTEAVDPIYLDQINSVDWVQHPWEPDNHWSDTFRRRTLIQPNELMQAIDAEILKLIPDINHACNTSYTGAASVWHLCEAKFRCPIHTDGHKPNVMIIYWQSPGSCFGTTFYNSPDPTDVWHEFPSIPNTGFFANYKPRMGRPWHEMWHASLQAVPENHYRLLTQYEFHK